VERILKPVKVTRTYTQKMVAAAARVFPLLCPVRELEWVPGWPLKAAFTESGVAERDCVFVTENESGNDSVWMITRHEPETFFVEMVKITPTMTACRLEIQLAETGSHSCDAIVSYTHVALSRAGEDFVRSFTAESYEAMMKEWESEINAYLSAT
jgi:hypothetical protein